MPDFFFIGLLLICLTYMDLFETYPIYKTYYLLLSLLSDIPLDSIRRMGLYAQSQVKAVD